uniref:Uncharacterized protein LOC108949271 n=1 Tax=Phallusia mammillata TaxID=59560 RepID=A0A6F9DJT6_9ASCI|nr:uncharacterized protein LOC108949271 [Phallusia mammillata]
MLTHRLADNRRGYPRSMLRSCSATDIETGCTDIQIGDTTYQQCNKTCSSDGCNHGMGGSSRPVTSLVVVFFASVMAFVAQFTFSQ